MNRPDSLDEAVTVSVENGELRIQIKVESEVKFPANLLQLGEELVLAEMVGERMKCDIEIDLIDSVRHKVGEFLKTRAV